RFLANHLVKGERLECDHLVGMMWKVLLLLALIVCAVSAQLFGPYYASFTAGESSLATPLRMKRWPQGSLPGRDIID
ncbi:hypothetical protein PMAYCL1PPCAC_04575, partial [Pristionchus mayeri]